MTDYFHGTTVLSVRSKSCVAMGSDGQVTMGQHAIIKHDAVKIRKLPKHGIIVGFAGATADAFALLEQFEGLLETYQSNLKKAAIELAKKWRMDKVLRRLEALLAVANKEHSLIISGNGDVIEPTNGILAIGSGGLYAQAAAQALLQHSELESGEIVKESLLIASSICVYTNNNINIEELKIERIDS
jgi:ATP-dependent HslUV protease subunit HslV